jgi:hypothetical protein
MWAVADQPPTAAAERLRRTEHLFVLIARAGLGDAMRTRPSHTTTRDVVIQFVLIVVALAVLLWWATS